MYIRCSDMKPMGSIKDTSPNTSRGFEFPEEG